MKRCLSHDEMVAFIEGNASAEDLTAWRRHLRVCDACATALAKVRAGSAPAAPMTRNRPIPGDVSTENCADVGLEPNLQIGGFRLEKRLGTGGMGVVYQAMQLTLNRRVALKVLPFNLAADASAVERFSREARAAAKLRHPNIVTIHAEGTERNACYFAMEMIDGQNLDQVIEGLRRAKTAIPSGPDRPGAPEDQGGRASVVPSVLHVCRSESEYFRTVASLVCEVASALDYAHGQGVIHRDVKPSNLMLARDGRLVLLDFGIARLREERAVTVSGSFVGTPRYMSPEQVQGKRVDGRSDIYATGIILYELLVGTPPFISGDIAYQQVNIVPTRPREICPVVSPEVDRIIMKCLEKKTDDRYPDARALRRALAEVYHVLLPQGVMPRSRLPEDPALIA